MDVEVELENCLTANPFTILHFLIFVNSLNAWTLCPPRVEKITICKSLSYWFY